MYRAGGFLFDTLVCFYLFDRINEAIADTERRETVKAALSTDGFNKGEDQ